MLNQYQIERDKLLGVYKKLEEMEGLFPIEGYNSEKITVDDLIRKREQLEEEHFFVSITGQIKSGKSTLINALIFKEEILPSDDTPHTAKITLIKYAKTPKLEVLFYSNEQWDELNRDEEFKKEIIEDLELSAKKGIYKAEVVKNTPLIKEDSIDSIVEYAAKGGKYTSFVNTVTLYYPNDILKEVTIVDTPGTNDPNKIRDRVAKEWISKTNANIYAIYANQAFSQVDIDFMDKYLLSVPKEQKITVVNKIDIADDLPTLKNWISSFLQDEALKHREIFDRDSSIIFLSGLAALIDKMDKSEKDRSKELDEEADRLGKIGYLDPSKYNILELESAIEEKLIQNKGNNILSSHRKYIDALFEKKFAFKESELSLLKSNIDDLGSSKEELEQKVNTIDQMVSELNEMRNDIDNEIKSNVDNIASEIEDKSNKIKGKTLKAIEIEIDKYDKIKHLESHISWIVKKEVNVYFEKIFPLIQESKDEIITIVNNTFSDIKNKLQKMDKDNTVRLSNISHIVYISSQELEYNIEKTIDYYMNDNEISKLVTNYKNFILPNDTKSAKGKLKEYSIDTLNKINRNIIEMFRDKITSAVKGKVAAKAEGTIRAQLNKRNDSIKNLIKNLDNKRENIDQEMKKMKNLEEEIAKIKILKDEIDGQK